MSSNVFVTIGIPFSGKSRWTNEFMSEYPNTIVICPDEIRKELTGDISDQSKNHTVFELAYDMLSCAVIAGEDNIIFDGTNITGRTRKKIFEVVESTGMEDVNVHYIVFSCDLSVALERKKNDAKRIADGSRSNVPDDIIERFYNSYNDNFENFMVDSRPKSINLIW